MKRIEKPALLKQYTERADVRNLFPSSVISGMYLCKAAADELIIRQGETIPCLYYLVKGKISVHTYLENGKKLILSNISAPSLIGEIELFGPADATMSVKALDEVILLCIDLDQYRDLLLNDNSFLRKLCALLADKEARNARRLIHTSGFPLKNRLAAFILGSSSDNVFSIRKIEAAESLGVSYRHLSLLMSQFVKDGFLRKEKFRYHIINHNALSKLAKVIEE